MKTLYGESAETARMTEWLRRSGLNAIDTNVAINHWRHVQAAMAVWSRLVAALRRHGDAKAPHAHA